MTAWTQDMIADDAVGYVDQLKVGGWAVYGYRRGRYD